MFEFDVNEALRSGIYVSGTTGIAKSDVGMYVADWLMNEGVVVAVFDGTQDWQNRSNVPFYVTVTGENMNRIELTPKSSMTYDISQLRVYEQKELVERFCQAIFENQVRTPKPQRKQYFIIWEEAHTYFPQGSFRSKVYAEAVRLVTQGRNFKIRFMVITQFASLLDKDVMKYCKQRFLGWTDEKNDVEYIKGFIGDNTEKLRKLRAGQFMYSYPSKEILTQIGIEPHVQNVAPERIYPESAIRSPASEPFVKPQANQQAIGQILIFGAWLLFILWLIFR